MQVSITIIAKFNACQFKYSVKTYNILNKEHDKKIRSLFWHFVLKELKPLTLPLHDGGTFA